MRIIGYEDAERNWQVLDMKLLEIFSLQTVIIITFIWIMFSFSENNKFISVVMCMELNGTVLVDCNDNW